MSQKDRNLQYINKELGRQFSRQRHLPPIPTQVPYPEPTWWDNGSNWHKMSSDLYILSCQVEAHTPLHTHTHTHQTIFFFSWEGYLPEFRNQCDKNYFQGWRDGSEVNGQHCFYRGHWVAGSQAPRTPAPWGSNSSSLHSCTHMHVYRHTQIINLKI